MQETRRLRLQSVIQEEISLLVSRELKDPRIPLITITAVELTHDAEQATIYVSILGSTQATANETSESSSQSPTAPSAGNQMKECLKGLTSASGFLRRHLARALNVRHVPTLIFRQDRGYENTIRVHELLKKISQT